MSQEAVRFKSLDALRGLSILGMAWSGMLPDTLPAWMYHGQLPPPKHEFRPDIFGITWVDLVFPFFLFSMGASIPIAISNRLNKGDSTFRIVTWLAGRGLLLVGFSIFGEHLRPYEWSASPDNPTWGISVLGFGLLVLMFGRWPTWMSKAISKALMWLACIASSVLIATHLYPDGKVGFENSRNDIILMVLANVAFSGAIIWMLTRCRPLVRIGIMAAVGLVFLSQSVPNSIAGQIWNFTPLQYLDLAHWRYSRFFPIFYHFEYHKYLLVVLPGTLCGDLILGTKPDKTSWPGWKNWSLAVSLVALVAVAVIGLFARETVLSSWGLGLASLGLVAWIGSPESATEGLVARMVRFGTGLLLIGLLAEPIGGGIRKDSPTLSYFLVTAGLAFFMLAALEIIVDLIKEARAMKFLWLTGMNPILGYAAITNLVMGLAGLTGYSAWLSASLSDSNQWGLAFADGGVKTLLVGIVACAFTKAKIFLRT